MGRPGIWAGPSFFRCRGPRPGPAYQFFIGWAAARPGPSKFQRMGRGPALPINFSDNGPRLGPARHIFRRWAATRPGPLNITFFRPGPAHYCLKFVDPAGPITFAARPMRNGPLHGLARHLCGPGPGHVLPRTKKVQPDVFTVSTTVFIIRHFRTTFIFAE